MFDLKLYLNKKSQIVNKALADILKNNQQGAIIDEAMQYSLMAGGKRIRPVLCLAAADTVGGNPADALTAACAMEMIHTYSLIHDDLPAMDNDELRRGKPTCHVAFDEATAVLAGDALLTLAFEVLASVPVNGPTRAAEWLQITRIIAVAAGSRGMIQGQMLDMAAEGRRLNLAELEAMHTLKTGALIEASLHCGALLAGASPAQQANLKSYARNIGLAFQVADDILNVEGNPEIMGKAVGTDRLNQKSTYPALLGLDASRQFARKLTRRALQALETFDSKAEPLRALATYIIERKR
ncbi:(2E,6E)-farnesyl diphosphate synthase (EC [Olavius algarvensis Delta 1 endosymbiont]|nr:(2E,6E)-farnesyl diphosphate synthase (EC [Olavius algarvensis Delta 1 endosymbiont]